MDLESLTERVVPAGTHFYAVGQDIGGASIVRVYNEDGSPARDITPFGAGFTGGARVAVGDVTGDGTDDIVVTAGPGGGPEVKVYDGATGAVVRDFLAYDPGFRGGVNVAVGDVNGDGIADVITGTGVSGGPNVRVFDGATGGLIDSFFAYESSFRGGVNVAAGDVNGDGKADVITGTGVGGGPRVQIFDGATGAEVANFFAYDAGVRSGVNVAAGDVEGTGKADVVTGVGFGAGPNVRVYDGTTQALRDSFFAYDPSFRGGVSVEVARSNGANDVLVAPGPSRGGYVQLLNAMTGAQVGLFQPFPTFTGGLTTGQGVATAAAPLSNVFAALPAVPPVPPSYSPPFDNSPDIVPDNTYVPSFDPGYTPPDQGYTPPPSDPGYTPPDPGSDC
jgi:hypothetical protein